MASFASLAKGLGKLGGNIGKIGATVGKIGGAVAGGPVGIGIAVGSSLLGGGKGGPPKVGPSTVAGIKLPDIGKPGKGFFGSARGRVKMDDGQCPRGYHLNKSKLADGTAPRSVCVRNRSMNPLNGRSAARAIKRLKRANKMVRKIAAFAGGRRSGGRGGHPSGCRCIACARRK